MARTAPVPNIPAIPGMNPGTFVMGGGGNGGGGNGSGRGGSGSKQGGKGGKGGKDAKGGGKNAGSCGPGKGGSCPNPKHGSGGTAAGDPVDPTTGRGYTIAVVDLALPGTIPLSIERCYSTSNVDVNVGLGPGWSHSLAWSIEERGRRLIVRAPDRAPLEMPQPPVGEPVIVHCGMVTRHVWGYTIDADRLAYAFAIAQRKTWMLTSIHDAHGNAIKLTYLRGVLASVEDSVGRVVTVKRAENGNIAAFVFDEESACFRSYVYDEAGRLCAAKDALGNAERYEYDERGLMLRRVQPGGMVAVFRYDLAGRCVETYCDNPGNDGLDPAAPETLVDGRPAKGFLHVRLQYGDGFTDVVTSRAARRVDSNDHHKPDRSVFGGGVHTYEYDAAGNVIGYADALGSVWRIERNAFGQITHEMDPLGGHTEIEYDHHGQVVAMRNPANLTARYERDRQGKVVRIDDDLGLVAEYVYDERGLLVSARLPNGGETTFEYDGRANRVRVVEPDGASRAMRYDGLGRIVAYQDENGGETRYTYDPCGRLRSVESPAGGVTSYNYDADGNLAEILDADGRKTRLFWGGVGVVTRVERPSGAVVEYTYDREQELLCVINEEGQRHRLSRDSEGRVVEEQTFDGRTRRYRLDTLGRVTAILDEGGTTELAYDALGRLVERVYPDDSRETLAYDAVGRLVEISSGAASCSYVYDARGRITRETITHDGQEQVTEYTYDSLWAPVKVAGPAGIVEVKRDVAGRPIRVTSGDRKIGLEYDGRGRETARTLSGGGRIESTHDREGRPVRTSVRRPLQAQDGEPEWVGPLAPGESWAKSFEWSAAGLLRSEGVAGEASNEIRRDAEGRVAEWGGRRFGYTPAGDLLEDRARRYDPGGRVRVCGDATYEYDARGRLIEKKVGDQSWSYGWSHDDRLIEVKTPDGRVVEMTYDPFARRLAKRVLKDGVVEKTTRYVWQGDALVGEISDRDERFFLVIPGTVLPIAQRTNGGALEHFVYEPNGMVVGLVDGLGETMSDAGGTSLRLPGQWVDEDVGLSYNGARYYDPDSGCFVSPEPMGLLASLKVYAYADFRLPEVIDPDGRVRTNIFGDPAGAPIASGQSGGDPSALHPAVAAALPPADANTSRVNDSRGRCGEPAAMSAHLHNWEANNPPNRCHPPDPNWQGNLQSALGEVNKNGGIQTGNTKGRNYPACENCSQMIPRLYTLAGMPPPGGVVAPGTAGPATNRPCFNPDPSFTSNPANAGYSGMPNPTYSSGTAPWPGGPPTLGTWQHSDGFTPGVTPPGSPGAGGGTFNRIR